MATSTEKKIGETTYRYTPVSARVVQPYLFVVAKMLLPSITKLAEATDAKVSLFDAMSGAAEALARGAEKEDFIAISKLLEGATEIQFVVSEGGHAEWLSLTKQFDAHFDRYPENWLPWLLFAADAQFSRFLTGNIVAEFLKQSKAAVASQPTESTGSSGG